MKKQPHKPYWAMTAAELSRATAEFDKPLSLSKTRALSDPERAMFERMQRSPHRSVFVTRTADGAFVRLDPELMRWCARYAARQKMSFSQVVAKSLQGMMAMLGS
jgi:hypothetical protein